MKYRKRSITCALLAGLTALTECKPHRPVLSLLSVKELSFPSASALVFADGRLFVLGDDATKVLVLDSAHRLLDSLSYFTGAAQRFSPDDKPDIESALVFGKTILAFGSMATSARNIVYRFDPVKRTADTVRNWFPFDREFPGVPERNVEGVCRVGNEFVLANRANNRHPLNHFVIWDEKQSLRSIVIRFPSSARVVGISDLYYDPSSDVLLLTASEEETASATADGTIHDSYIGWIRHFSKQMKEKEMEVNGLINLSRADGLFQKQKIEGIAVEKTDGGQRLIHLAADNDNGRSRLFRILLQFPEDAP